MKDAVTAYRAVTAKSEFRELERMRERARHDEASALAYARETERAKWETVVAEQATALADKDAAHAIEVAEYAAQIAELQKRLGNKK